ncbi:dNTP triphosphohydrolase [Pelagibacteraceae bacterium]|nr:dNTP triphosphohydrolase [Pelagibacteraceae bacterium]
MQKKYKENHLKLYATKSYISKGRIFTEKLDKIRTPYQRDRDRIIHSSSFRRLKHKTQVFVNTEGDHYRTRLTHSMEVSQISRTIARCLGLNEDLCETLSLAHDLGHTPFGHAGEEVLNSCMENYDGFDHNLQTLRIVTLLENKYFNFLGLNLTIETLDGLIKHNGPLKNTYNFKKILNTKYFRNKIIFNNSPSLEAQISSISDDIAYNNHDLEDGLRANLFSIDKLNSIPFIANLIKKNNKNNKNYRREVLVNQIVRKSISKMVMDVIQTTEKNLKEIKPKNIKDIYKQNRPIVDFSNKMKKWITK